MIAIVDYGAGNVASVKKAFVHLGARAELTKEPVEIRNASAVVLPGVGNFAALASLSEPVREALLAAITKGKPFLGVCLGMQWLFEGSDEAENVKGSALFAGKSTKFESGVKSPHVGWNQVEVINGSKLMKGTNGEHFYFTHSFRISDSERAAATTLYGKPFIAAVESKNLFGVQFHPEKSGDAGLKVLKNFCEMLA